MFVAPIVLVLHGFVYNAVNVNKFVSVFFNQIQVDARQKGTGPITGEHFKPNPDHCKRKLWLQMQVPVILQV